ncbi:MAG: thioesterase family protein [Clostridia bacterium]|jgi:predicted thioesterase|nr:thioesterase family protein [Clostridia bacterium]
MDFNIKTGMKAELEIRVEDKHTAEALGSGGVKVFATPMMIALMEGASLKAASPALPDDYTTVGVSLNVQHIAATPVGMKVTAKSELINVEGKKLTFRVEAFDEIEKIGEGTHERYIVQLPRFVEKAEKKGQ